MDKFRSEKTSPSQNLSFEDLMFLGTIKFPLESFLQFNQRLITLIPEIDLINEC